MKSSGTRIIEGMAYISAGKMAVKIFSLVTFLIVIRNLSLKDYGLLQLLFSLVGPAVVISMFGIERLLVADIAVLRAQGDFGSVRKLLRDYLVATLMLLAVLLVFAWFLRVFLSGYYHINLDYYYWSVVFLILGQAAMNFVSIVYESHEKFNYASFFQTGESFFRLLFILVLYSGIGFSLNSVFWVYTAAKIAVTFFGIPFAVALLKPGRGIKVPGNLLFSIIRKHGKWEIIRHISATTIDGIWPWVVNAFVNPEGVALFSFVQRIHSAVVSVLPIKSVLFPILAGAITKNREVARIIITKAKKYLLFSYLFVYIAILLFAKPLIGLIVPQYLLAVPLLWLTMTHLFLDVYSLGQSAVLYALKKQEANFALSTISIILTGVTQVAFVYLWGIYGLPISWLFVTFSTSLLREYILKNYYSFPTNNWPSLFKFDGYDKLIWSSVSKKIKGFFGFRP